MRRFLSLISAISIATISVYAGEGLFLTVGGIDTERDGKKIEAEYGTIFTSTDGKTWTQAFKGGPVTEDFSHANNNMLRCLTYGYGRFVATGNAKAVVTSEDGQNWEVVPAPRGAMSVAFGNGVFLAPSAGEFMRSADGKSWETVKPEADFKIWGNDGAGHVRKTVFGNGVFVCIGEQRIGVTKDGSSWLHHRLIPAEDRARRQILLFGAGRFVWMTDKHGVRTSTDGIDWEPSELNDLKQGEGVFGYDGVFDGSHFWAAAAHWKSKAKQIFRSADGLAWQVATTTSDLPRVTTAGNGLLLGNVGHAKSFRYSADGGQTWSEAKVDVASRQVYFFDGKQIIGQSGG